MREIENVNAGRVVCGMAEPWGYSGCPLFVTRNGWLFRVFNDCDEFDYFATIESPEGEVLDFGDQPDCLLGVCSKIDADHRERWGIFS